ncbi:TIGR03790 family protein [Phycisphaeraceae bacterium D3-23]
MMPTTLEQTILAGFPDDGPGAVGLRATMTVGTGGSYLSHTLGATPTVLHVRLLLAPGSAAGGSAHVAGGWSASGAVRWSIVWDADARQLSLNVPGSTPLSAMLPPVIGWHAVEVALDSAGGSASLRLNGLPVGSISGAAIGGTDVAWLGVQAKSNALAGTLDLDGWVIADAPIGLRLIEATHPHAGDPARWLVVYNADHADGAAWADYYRNARDVPYANLCGLSLPLDETITSAQYDALRDAVLAYLSDNGLATQVVGVLLGLGVPGYVDASGLGQVTAVSSLLHGDASGDGMHVNALHRDPPIDRPSAGALAGLRFTGRIDGADFAEAVALVDRATALMASPPRAEDGATVWLDPVTEDENVNPLFGAPMSAWATGPGPATLRLPVELTLDGQHDAVHDDFVFWGWGQASVPTGFFAQPRGRRGVCVQLESTSPEAKDQRSPGATHWLRQAVDAGYAAASASSRVYTLSALPQPGVFFEALRLGWTLAEAWMVCQPFVRSGMQMLGDPLLVFDLPRSGFDIYGPAEALEQIDITTPTLRLPDTAASVVLSDALAPPDDSPALYLVRRVDGAGRNDGGSSAVRVQVVGNQVLTPPALPAWPDVAGWPARVIRGEARVVAVWASALQLRGVTRVEAEADTPSGVQGVWDGEPTPGVRSISARFDVPDDASRVRWRVHHADGAQGVSPWSAALIDSPTSVASFPEYEVQP